MKKSSPPEAAMLKDPSVINTDIEDSLAQPDIDGWHNGRCYIAIDVRLRKGILVVSVDGRRRGPAAWSRWFWRHTSRWFWRQTSAWLTRTLKRLLATLLVISLSLSLQIYIGRSLMYLINHMNHCEAK